MELAARLSPRDTGEMLRLIAPDSFIGRFVRYGSASATATVVDLAVYAPLVALGMFAGTAASIGYVVGTVWHWFYSSRLVFADKLAEPGRNRRRQQMLFAASAVLGLVVTAVIVSWMTYGGFDPATSRFASMCVAFTSVWLMRLLVVFAAPEDADGDENEDEALA